MSLKTARIVFGILFVASSLFLLGAAQGTNFQPPCKWEGTIMGSIVFVIWGITGPGLWALMLVKEK